MLKTLTAQYLTPDNEGVIVRFLVWLFGVNWKTSLSGFLSLGISIFGGATALIGVLQPFLQTKWPLVVPVSTAVLSVFSGLGKVWVGLLQVDAGQQVVLPPNAVEPVVVPSHEEPDTPIPGATIVKE